MTAKTAVVFSCAHSDPSTGNERFDWLGELIYEVNPTYIIDLGDGAFATGQTYVALSRCKTLDALSLYRELKTKDALVDPDIQAFHKARFR